MGGSNWYAGCIFHSADLRVVTNVHETSTWWSAKVKNGAGCVPTRPLPLRAKGSGIIYPNGTHTVTNSLHFHQAFVFTRRCGGREVVRISERAGHFIESRNGSLGRTCGAVCTPLPPFRPPIRLRVEGCWEGHNYSRSTRGTCPAGKRVVQ